ncbi:MAG: tRNA uridine-5-carboxymethylaminomethyl(34) synthesis GTPase MnmE [Thermodesulfovibrio sp. RBG_19FT_COMBO_42_12]|nr:MAG: tRNA uridine-5-carboxymethylaminomethyl(34) synthesis GTPase MnmE [Thermodesulfovibrio sp. RBG_19FT_COMBO_42_12]HZX48768.1 tRNA uridine-5-carboxymethylaminomethyl(34) synthesis GTPase MnmE [Nitrospirota bacterium]
MINQENTVCAIITPPGTGGISVIRLSGKDAISIASKVFRKKSGKSLNEVKTHSIHHGHILDLSSGEVIDEVLAGIMKSPHSYTGEDVVEISCHGGPLVTGKILEVFVREGAGHAGPGEFTRRAFLNGRIDLAQAEAVIDLINSKSQEGLRSAIWQLEGGISRKINELRDVLTVALASLEAFIDFPEEDIDVIIHDIEGRIRSSVESIDKLIDGYYRWRPFREGIVTAIVGRTNVGKSSLLNVLLGEERAIVTPHPGTTRDIVDGLANVDGLPLRILDTAGLRTTEDLVEGEGIKRMFKSIESSELVLLVIDGSEPLTEWDEELLTKTDGKKRVIIINKIDKGNMIQDNLDRYNSPVVCTAIINGEGIEPLRKLIRDTVVGGVQRLAGEAVVTNLRHKNALEQSNMELNNFLEALHDRLPLEIQALHLRGALDLLGEVTGVVTTEDILDRVFSEFCIGK